MVLMVLSQYLLLFLIQLTEGIHEIHEERKCSKTKGTQKPSFINLLHMCSSGCISNNRQLQLHLPSILFYIFNRQVCQHG